MSLGREIQELSSTYPGRVPIASFLISQTIHRTSGRLSACQKSKVKVARIKGDLEVHDSLSISSIFSAASLATPLHFLGELFHARNITEPALSKCPALLAKLSTTLPQRFTLPGTRRSKVFFTLIDLPSRREDPNSSRQHRSIVFVHSESLTCAP